ncbi:hypothetical protein ACWDZ4_29420 [Streptomyces sp. NPDC003016]
MTPVGEFSTGVKRNVFAEDELIAAVHVSPAKGPQQSAKADTVGGGPVAMVHPVAAEAGQGLVEVVRVTEEIKVEDGRICNPSLTDYPVPAIMDMPPMTVDVIERGDPNAPSGGRGVGEPPTTSATPAVVDAVRDATGPDLTHTPVAPEHIVCAQPR